MSMDEKYLVKIIEHCVRYSLFLLYSLYVVKYVKAWVIKMKIVIGQYPLGQSEGCILKTGRTYTTDFSSSVESNLKFEIILIFRYD